jgi:hypothetical protein
MCIYSLSARKGYDMRNAKVGETLTQGEYRGHSVFKGDDGKLACIKHGTTMVFDCIQFDCTTAPWLIEKYAGQTVTVTLIEGGCRLGRHYAADCIKFEDGFVLHLNQLKDGTVARIPRKVRKDKGIAKPRNLSKILGLDQIRAEIDPNPKPEDEQPVEQKPVEQEPAPEPAPETAVPYGWDKVEA